MFLDAGLQAQPAEKAASGQGKPGNIFAILLLWDYLHGGCY